MSSDSDASHSPINNMTSEKSESTVDSEADSAKRRRAENDPTKSIVGEPLIKKNCALINHDLTPISPPPAEWEAKKITSVDGASKLSTQIMYASFDQFTSGAQGWGACSVIAAFTSYWLLSSPEVPSRKQLDNLIVEGSHAWYLLCSNDPNITNVHLDLETVKEAGIVPIDTCPKRSSIAFFGTNKFEALKEAMSVDKIWDEIAREEQDYPAVYIVSWNDHFFVLMAAEGGVFYVIDSFGGRLCQGLKRAYILKFDASSVILGREGGRWRRWSEVCRGGRDCCIEFLKRFLAAPIMKLLEEEKFDTEKLYSKAQVDFHYVLIKSQPPPPSPSTSSSSASSSSYSSGSSVGHCEEVVELKEDQDDNDDDDSRFGVFIMTL